MQQKFIFIAFAPPKVNKKLRKFSFFCISKTKYLRPKVRDTKTFPFHQTIPNFFYTHDPFYTQNKAPITPPKSKNHTPTTIFHPTTLASIKKTS